MSARNVKRPTLEKLERDAEAVRESARFVIVIENNGSVNLIDNGYRLKEGLPVAYMIAVIGWTEYEDVPLQTIKFEVTYHRHRPYKQIENVSAPDPYGRRHWFIKPRYRIDRLASDEIRDIYPILRRCMAQIVLECREAWSLNSRQEDWKIRRVGDVSRGIRFSVSTEDDWLVRELMLEHMHNMTERKVLTKHMRCMKFWIGHYRYLYPAERLKKFSGACNVAGLIANCYSTAAHQAIILYAIEKQFKHSLLYGDMPELLRHVMKSFGVLSDEENVERFYQLLMDDALDEDLSGTSEISCYIPNRKPSSQGKGCLVADILLGRQYRERNEVPF